MDLWQKHLESNWNAFDTYRVKLRLNDIVGGKPATSDMIDRWVDATCKAKKDEDRQKIKDAHIDTLPDLAEEKADKQTCVFARVDGVLCIEGRQVKAMLKEAANITKTIVPGGTKKAKKGETETEDAVETGVKNFRAKVADQVFVPEKFILLTRDGQPITEPDALPERPIHVITAQGPRTSLKRVEAVYNCEIEFTIKRRKGRDAMAVPEASIAAILDYAQSVGLGADRSQGSGTFEVLSIAKLDE